MPEVGVESPVNFGHHLGEIWGNGQVSCEKLQSVAVSCGNHKPIHRLIFDARSDKFIFIYDDGRSEKRRTSQDAAIPEDVLRLRDKLQKAETRARKSDQEYGSLFQQGALVSGQKYRFLFETQTTRLQFIFWR